MTLAVIGLGYVGLPLALEACRSGLTVIGFDRSESVVRSLREARSHVDDIDDEDVGAMLAAGFQPTTDPADLRVATTYIICVPTPLTPGGGPDLAYVESAADTIADNLKTGDLVVLESTTYPGTTEQVLAPLLEHRGRPLRRRRLPPRVLARADRSGQSHVRIA